MSLPSPVATWPSLADLPALYPDPRNRVNRGPLVYRAGKTWPLWSTPDTAGRIPLLAVGSNGYPRQLHDKLAGSPTDLQGIPILPIILRDFDVAYCPIRSRQGYIPVTLANRPGAVCLTWLQWLTPEQLNIISASEGSRYSLVGGPSLAERALIRPQLRRPRSFYAWWVDSVLERNGSTLWLDVARGNPTIDFDRSTARPNVPPSDWRQVPREAGTHAIAKENMSELC